MGGKKSFPFGIWLWPRVPGTAVYCGGPVRMVRRHNDRQAADVRESLQSGVGAGARANCVPSSFCGEFFLERSKIFTSWKPGVF
ncbi:hypothetical protein R1flu_025399 [Riccia fluitans]|uniref:Secreted protein n=1 Tax=Riccia fluitans TaxID=41844 RepID=A0ABD1XXU0_9MARC